MTEVTPPLENTRFSPFFDFTVLRPPGIAALLLILSLLMLRLAAPVNDINIHFDSNEMQALCTGMQKRLAVYAVISSMAFFVQPQAFGVLSASACVVALCVLFARMGLGITVIQ